MRFWDRYKGLLRRVKAFYLVNNLVNLKHLRFYKPLYQSVGLKRPVWASLRHRNFNGLDPSALMPEVQPQRPDFITDDMMAQWEKDGLLILRGFFQNEAGSINEEIESLLNSGKVQFNFTGNKIHFANLESELIRSVLNSSKLQESLAFLLGRRAVPFQTINFYYGSEQKAHSDSIHMSTFPEGNLIAAWVALDKIEEDNGPVFYYQGSHKWPYLYNEDIGVKENALLLDSNPNGRYEAAIASLIEEKGVEPEMFEAEPGDLLIWHANLAHGGSPHINKDKTRRSMVMHFFGENVICYHELTQRPAIIK